MNFLLILLGSLLVISALLLIAVIMLQNPQDESGATAYSGYYMKMLGASAAPDLLEQGTRLVAILCLGLILLTSYVMQRNSYAGRETYDTFERVQNYKILDKEK